MNIPSDVEYIIKTLNHNGYEAYIVGGCVRDFLLNTEPKDWDITTSALPQQTKALFEHTYDTGIEHGTITVVLNHNNYEVTTYRIDGDYVDFRHPEGVIFTEHIEEDLSRRDFTMNAIAYHSEKGFVDPFDGRAAIKAKCIKGVGDAHKRFNEDALRMLRALRFSAQLGFDIEPATYEAIINNAELIKNISAERIRDEFLKLICSPYTEKITLLVSTGLYAYFFPELKDILNNATDVIQALKNADKNITARLCIILSSIEHKRCEELLKALRLDNKTIKAVLTIVKYLDYPLKQGLYPTRVLLSELDEPLFRLLLKTKQCFALAENNSELYELYTSINNDISSILDKGECFSLKSLAINGNDITQLGIKDGKLIGKGLHLAFNKVLEYPELNERDILIDIVKKELLS